MAQTKTYEVVDFNAWTYQDTPASWAYLYEQMANGYLGPKKKRLRYHYKLIRLNWHRFGPWPSLKLIGSILFTAALIILLKSQLPFNWLHWLAITIPGAAVVVGTLGAAIRKKYSTDAKTLINQYGRRTTFKGSMGIQADIQDELVKLLKAWVPDEEKERRRILLRVDDADRCPEERILPIIDALRVMLEEKTISERLIIVTAIDERILRSAIRLKYRELDKLPVDKLDSQADKTEKAKLDSERIIEYMDKLFIGGIRLGSLSVEYKDQFLDQLFDGDRQEVEQIVPDEETVPNETPQEPVEVEGENEMEQEIVQTPVPEWAELDLEEERLIKETLHDWPEATPRKMTIFYYRYLLTKNILISNYTTADRVNPWMNKAGIKVLLSLLSSFGKKHEIDRIGLELEKLRGTDAPPDLPGLNELTHIPKEDFQLLLETLELVVAY